MGDNRLGLVNVQRLLVKVLRFDRRRKRYRIHGGSGRALFELVWDPEEGADQKSVTNCLSCHSQPNSGGAARVLFSQSTLHPASMWGGGAEELMVTQLKAAGVPGLTNPHGSLGSFPTIRGAISGASDDHFGIQTSEKVANLLGNPGGYDAVDDPDHDGVANEQSVGETTAETVTFIRQQIGVGVRVAFSPEQSQHADRTLTPLGIECLVTPRLGAIERDTNPFDLPVWPVEKNEEEKEPSPQVEDR